MEKIRKFKGTELENSATAIIKQAMQQLKGEEYVHDKAKAQSEKICSDIITNWTKLNNTHFKFIVSCSVMEKAEYGIYITASSYWDNEVDGSIQLKEEFDKIVVIVTAFACGV